MSSPHPNERRARAAEEALVERCRELETFVNDDKHHINAAEVFRRWTQRTGHTIEEHLGSAEMRAFFRAMPDWSEALTFSSVPDAAAHHALGYLVPLLHEIRSAPADLFRRIDKLAAKHEPARSSPKGTEVFIVHGHNHRMLEEVADFIHRVHGVRPTILHEQADAGRTIIEKLEHFAARACFAVVLLTSDDPSGKGQAYARAKRGGPRHARQNVILELGYFWAKLTRQRVVILYEEGIVLPSDSDGVLYKLVDEHAGWKRELAKEMQSAGLSIDLTKAPG